jgi:transcription termination factor NusB
MAKAERSAARLAAVQALYQMDVAGKGLTDAMAEFEAFWIGREVEGITFAPAENAFFRELLVGTVEHQRAVDPMIDTRSRPAGRSPGSRRFCGRSCGREPMRSPSARMSPPAP